MTVICLSVWLSVPFMAISAQIPCFFRVTFKPSTCFGFCLLGSVFKFKTFYICCLLYLELSIPGLFCGWFTSQFVAPSSCYVCRGPMCQHLVLSSFELLFIAFIIPWNDPVHYICLCFSYTALPHFSPQTFSTLWQNCFIYLFFPIYSVLE
jgi:hypothetical protein